MLWWLNGMGEYFLYKVDVIVEVGGFSGLFDLWSYMFGFCYIVFYIDIVINGWYIF